MEEMKHYIALAFWTTFIFSGLIAFLIVFGYINEWDKQIGINLDREGVQNVEVKQTVLSAGH